MKTFLALAFAASLALNATLAYFALSSRSAAPSTPTRAANSSVAATASTGAADAAIDPEAWANLSTAELPDLVTRLRASGFPIEMIRAILAAQINESFAARRKALDPGAENRPFWKDQATNPQVQVALRQSYREQQKMLRELLGNDAEGDDPMNAVSQGRRTDGLPPDKVDEVKRIMREFNDQRQDLYASLAGTTLDREKLAALEKGQQDAIARLLSPQELEEYNLRNHRTASQLRYELTAFNPTEEEFRAMFRLKQPFDERFSPMFQTGPMPQELMRERMTAQKTLTEQIKAALSPERAAEYDRATDYNYRQTSQLVARLEMPPETTNQVYEIQKDIQQRMQSVYSSRDLQVRNDQMAVLAAEARTKIGAVLGARGFEAYKQYGGDWMQQLAPVVPRPPQGATSTSGTIIRVAAPPGN